MGNVEALLVQPVTLLSSVFVFIVCKSLTERQGYFLMKAMKYSWAIPELGL